jgi:hypothetical protein
MPLKQVALICALLVFAACASPGSLPHRPVAREGYFTGADRTPLFYRTMGSGPDTVVVVHGFQGNSQNYLAPDLSPLADGSTLLFYDQRGMRYMRACPRLRTR